MKKYEGMLLVEPTIAAREWEKVVEEVDRVAKRNEANVLAVTKWGERKLAYSVDKNNRGAYVLAYLEASPDSMVKIRADLELSEVVLRNLFLRHEGEILTEAPKDFETAGFSRPKPMGDRDRDDGGDRHRGRFSPRG